MFYLKIEESGLIQKFMNVIHDYEKHIALVVSKEGISFNIIDKDKKVIMSFEVAQKNLMEFKCEHKIVLIIETNRN